MAEEKTFVRLGDQILIALNLALDQKDTGLADVLARALEMALTRGAGGKNFTERRDLPADVEKAMERLSALKKAG